MFKTINEKFKNQHYGNLHNYYIQIFTNNDKFYFQTYFNLEINVII